MIACSLIYKEICLNRNVDVVVSHRWRQEFLVYSLFLWFESHLSGKPNKLKWFVVNSFKDVLIMETKTSFVM